MIFELLQFSYKGIPATFGNADSEHNEEGIQTTLLYDHPMFSQILGDNAGGDAHRSKITLNIQARSNYCGLNWIQHVEIFS